jgi:hypothetical protein
LFDAFVLAYDEAEEPDKYQTTASLGPGYVVVSGHF